MRHASTTGFAWLAAVVVTLAAAVVAFPDDVVVVVAVVKILAVIVVVLVVTLAVVDKDVVQFPAEPVRLTAPAVVTFMLPAVVGWLGAVDVV